MMRRANQLVTSSKKMRHVMGLGADFSFTHLLARRHGGVLVGVVNDASVLAGKYQHHGGPA